MEEFRQVSQQLDQSNFAPSHVVHHKLARMGALASLRFGRSVSPALADETTKIRYDKRENF